MTRSRRITVYSILAGLLLAGIVGLMVGFGNSVNDADATSGNPVVGWTSIVGAVVLAAGFVYVVARLLASITEPSTSAHRSEH